MNEEDRKPFGEVGYLDGTTGLPTGQAGFARGGSILIGLSLYAMLRLVIKHKQMRHDDLSNKLIAQGTIRTLFPPIFVFIGIFYAYYNISVSYFLFMFPIVFNIIPGTLDVPEKFILRIIQKVKRSS